MIVWQIKLNKMQIEESDPDFVTANFWLRPLKGVLNVSVLVYSTKNNFQ